MNLTLADHDDQEFKQLSEHIRRKIHNDNRWYQLTALLIQIGHFNEAEALVRIWMKKTPIEDEKELSFLCH